MVAHTRLGQGLSNTGRGLLYGTRIPQIPSNGTRITRIPSTGTRISRITATGMQPDADLADHSNATQGRGSYGSDRRDADLAQTT